MPTPELPPGFQPLITPPPTPPPGFEPLITAPPAGPKPTKYVPKGTSQEPAPPPPSRDLGDIIDKPIGEFLGGAAQTAKQVITAPFQLGAEALAQTGLAVAALGGDKPSQRVWGGQLKGLHDQFLSLPEDMRTHMHGGELLRRADTLLGQIVDDQVQKFHANPARYAGGAFVNALSWILPGRVTALRKVGRVKEADEMATRAANVKAMQARMDQATQARGPETTVAPEVQTLRTVGRVVPEATRKATVERQVFPPSELGLGRWGTILPQYGPRFAGSAEDAAAEQATRQSLLDLLRRRAEETREAPSPEVPSEPPPGAPESPQDRLKRMSELYRRLAGTAAPEGPVAPEVAPTVPEAPAAPVAPKRVRLTAKGREQLTKAGVTPESLLQDAHDRNIPWEQAAAEALTKHGFGSPPAPALVAALRMAMFESPYVPKPSGLATTAEMVVPKEPAAPVVEPQAIPAAPAEARGIPATVATEAGPTVRTPVKRVGNRPPELRPGARWPTTQDIPPSAPPTTPRKPSAALQRQRGVLVDTLAQILQRSTAPAVAVPPEIVPAAAAAAAPTTAAEEAQVAQMAALYRQRLLGSTGRAPTPAEVKELNEAMARFKRLLEAAKRAAQNERGSISARPTGMEPAAPDPYGNRALAEQIVKRWEEVEGGGIKPPRPPRGASPGTPGGRQEPTRPAEGWPAVVAESMGADAYAKREIFNAENGFDSETMRQRTAPDHKLTVEQKRELTNLVHSEASPLHTGAWPEYVSPGYRESLARNIQEQLQTEARNAGIEPDIKAKLEELVGPERETPPTTGPDGRAYDAEGKPWFPRLNLVYALASMGFGGYKGFRGKGGSRAFYEATGPNEQKLLLAVRGGVVLVHDATTGDFVPAAAAAKSGGRMEGTTITLDREAAGLPAGTELKLHSALPTTVRGTGEAEYVDDPILVSRHSLKRAKSIEWANKWRREVTDGNYSHIALPKDEAPAGWVKAPFLAKDWMAHPNLNKIIQRIKGQKVGEARWNLLNNLWVGTLFYGLPWGHHPNILVTWAVAEPIKNALGILPGQMTGMWQKAAHQVETYGEDFQRFAELGGGRQHIQARLKQEVEQAMREASQTPEAKQGIWNRVKASWPMADARHGTKLQRYDDFTHAVPWSIDAKAKLQLVYMLQHGGMPFDEAVGVVLEKVPNYWLPSFWPAPRWLPGAFLQEHTQQLYDWAHGLFTHPIFIFSPYHGTLTSAVWHAVSGRQGPSGFMTILATLGAGKLVDTVLIKPLAQAAANHYAEKMKTAKTPQERSEADYQRARMERLHDSLAGYGTLVEGVAGAEELLRKAALSPYPGKALRRVAFPAAGMALRPILTPGPIGAAIGLGEAVLSGTDPTDQGPQGQGGFHGLIPFGMPPLNTSPDKWAEWAGQKARLYPRYYLPTEAAAANFAKTGLLQARKQAYLDPAHKTEIVRGAMETLYALNLMAARDLVKAGLLKTKPEAWAWNQTKIGFKTAQLALPGFKQRMPTQQPRPPRP